ncbi:Rap1a/Tai family immunity protein [Pseudomonas fluorescens]|uniref:Rap1a/Tai family immunity protein n=1 Tax=Pseudomonas fluorescens TaxID=294 RepID=UPI00124296BF|nr:Rap1a/Tai family immunity protein [Pseudomonas fluorescens]
MAARLLGNANQVHREAAAEFLAANKNTSGKNVVQEQTGGQHVKPLLVIATMGMFLSTTVIAGTVKDDGNTLLAQCQYSLQLTSNATPDYSVGSCFGTVSAVMNTMTILYFDLPKEAKACFPRDGIQYGQAVRIVTRYLSEHPSRLHETGATLSIAAFKEAFPCR